MASQVICIAALSALVASCGGSVAATPNPLAVYVPIVDAAYHPDCLAEDNYGYPDYWRQCPQNQVAYEIGPPWPEPPEALEADARILCGNKYPDTEEQIESGSSPDPDGFNFPFLKCMVGQAEKNGFDKSPYVPPPSVLEAYAKEHSPTPSCQVVATGRFLRLKIDAVCRP